MVWVLLLAVVGAAGAEPSVASSKTGRPTISWLPVDGAVSYELVVRNEMGDTIFTRTTRSTSLTVTLDPGTYFVRVAAIDVFGKAASYSPWHQIRVYRSVPPRAEAVSPALLYRGTGTHELVVTGKDFLPGVTCTILAGNAVAGRAEVSEVAPGGLHLRLDTDALPAGTFGLHFENPGGSAGQHDLALTVRNRSKPVLIGLSRKAGYNDHDYRHVTVDGSGFVAGIEVSLQRSGRKVDAAGVRVDSATRLTVDFNLGGVAPGSYDLVAVNPGGESARLASVFTVENIGMPEFASIQPDRVTEGRDRYRFAVSGSGFLPATSFAVREGGTAIPAEIVGSPSGSSANLSLPGNLLKPGSYDLVINNGINFRSVSPGALVVRRLPKTALDGLSVASGTDAQLLKGVVVSGRNLRSGERFYLARGSAMIGLSGRVDSPTRAVLSFDLRRQPVGRYSLEVFDGAKLVGSIPKGFRIVPHPVPPRSFVTLQLGWPYTFPLPTGSSQELGSSWQAGDLRMGINLGNQFLTPIPILRRLGLEVDGGFNRLTGKSGGTGSQGSVAVWHVGTDLFYETEFPFPVNFVARGGWGLAFSSFDKLTALGGASGTSSDFYVEGGAGIHLLIAKLFTVEAGAELMRILYAGSNLDTLGVFVQSGVKIGI